MCKSRSLWDISSQWRYWYGVASSGSLAGDAPAWYWANVDIWLEERQYDQRFVSPLVLSLVMAVPAIAQQPSAIAGKPLFVPTAAAATSPLAREACILATPFRPIYARLALKPRIMTTTRCCCAPSSRQGPGRPAVSLSDAGLGWTPEQRAVLGYHRLSEDSPFLNSFLMQHSVGDDEGHAVPRPRWLRPPGLTRPSRTAGR